LLKNAGSLPKRHVWLLQDASRLAFGGGSFAGVTALLAAVSLPHVFGGILVESPSLWVGEGRFLRVRHTAVLLQQQWQLPLANTLLQPFTGFNTTVFYETYSSAADYMCH
jgi:enterochelin esterase-like enzyme